MKIFKSQIGLSFDFSEKHEAANITPYGFREYDARWLYPDQINKKGLEVFGYGLGQYISDIKGSGSSIVVGHDYRSYSEEVCLLYTSPSPRDGLLSRMPSSA